VSRALRSVARAAGQRRLAKLFDTGGDLRRSIIENARIASEDDVQTLSPHIAAYPERERVLNGSEARSVTRLGGMLHFEQRTYLPGLLTRLDKSSMASALECRTPFLDYRLVEWSYQVPDQMKIRTGRANKFIVKSVAERWLPPTIVHRKKSGFGSPMAQWLRNPKSLGRYLELLTDRVCRERGLFEPSAIERLLDEHLVQGRDHAEILWTALNLELWCRTFIDAAPAAPLRRVQAVGAA